MRAIIYILSLPILAAWSLIFGDRVLSMPHVIVGFALTIFALPWFGIAVALWGFR